MPHLGTRRPSLLRGLLDGIDCEQDEIVGPRRPDPAASLPLRAVAPQRRTIDDGGRREELFVCDCENLQVFSLAGKHRRSITGEWKHPEKLWFVKDRLYLVEEGDAGEEGDPLCGKWILVLSLQGDTLQVFTLPDDQACEGFCCFGNQLLVTCNRSPADERAMLALSGV